MTDMTGETHQNALDPAPRDADAREAKLRAGLEKEQRLGERLRRNARANYRAMEGSLGVRSEEDWTKVVEQSRQQYESGAFLLDRMGGERFLDPQLVATLMGLRQKFMVEWNITTAAETMLLDLAMLHYYHVLRVQGWIGDFALHLEQLFFGSGAFAAEYRDLPPELAVRPKTAYAAWESSSCPSSTGRTGCSSAT